MVGEGFQCLDVAVIEDIGLHAADIDHGHGLLLNGDGDRQFGWVLNPFHRVVSVVLSDIIAKGRLAGVASHAAIPRSSGRLAPK